MPTVRPDADTLMVYPVQVALTTAVLIELAVAGWTKAPSSPIAKPKAARVLRVFIFMWVFLVGAS